MKTSEIHVAPVDSSDAGGCNGCTEHSGPGLSYRVWQVTARGQSMRLCDKCAGELHSKLADAFRGGRSKKTEGE
jgi:hypothetical protein